MRRAKSFMVRKNKYNPDSDDNNNEQQLQQQQQQQQQKGHFINLKRSHTKLVRRKSSSFDNVLLLQDIKSNNLYLQQQKKYDSADEILVDKMQENQKQQQQQAKQHWGRIRELIGKYENQPIDNNNNNNRTTERSNYKKLQKRISISLDETIFPLPDQTEIRTRKTNNNNNNYTTDIGETSRIRGSFQRIHTIDVIRELMTNFENGGGAGANGANTNKLPKIPMPTKEELEGVELRSRNVTTNQQQQQQQRSIRSQTVNFDSSRTKNEQSFEIKGPFKIIINNEKCAKININQKLILSNNQLRIVEILSDDLLIINKLNTNNSPQQQRQHKQQQQQQQQQYKQNEIILENNVEFRKNTIKLINKKDIEIKDVNNRQYLIQFEINKDAKQFYDIINDTQTKITIKTKLLRLLGMRSSRDLLESKGILKNEPIFGNTINDIYYINNNQQQQQIPEFLIKIIELIELPTNIKSLGIYRTSGNLAIIQKIRFEIDNGNINILNDYKDDVDVLTGCLKLFFRELKTLIIPEDVFQQLINLLINNNNNQHQNQLENKEIFNHLDKIIKQNLPKPNREILTYLLKHLVKVDEFNQFNKMDIHNLSICWGPSLINNLNGGQENCCLNLVSQTNQITRIMEYLILYQKQLINNNNNNCDKRRDNTLKIINNNNDNEDEAEIVQIYESIKKLIDLIEININIEGIYKKSGSEERKRWILQKIKQNQLDDLNLNNNNSDNCNGIDVHDYCSALKKYLTTLKKPLISIEMQEQFYKDCDNLDKKQLCENLRKTIDSSLNRDALILLLRHIKKVQQYNNISIPYLLHYWTITLITPIDRNNLERIEKFQYLLELLIELVDNNSQLPDLILINNQQQQQQQQQQRGSIYDNVFREATFLDDNKTDTKL